MDKLSVSYPAGGGIAILNVQLSCNIRDLFKETFIQREK